MGFINECLSILGTIAYKTIGRFIIPLFIHNTDRTRVLIVAGDQVLLCKMIISSGLWNIPGGGVKRGEDIVVGAVREVTEEVGIRLHPSHLQKLGTLQHKSNAGTYISHIFFIEHKKVKTKMRWPEILEIKWFHIDALPDNINSDAKVAISRYKHHA